MTLPNTVFIRRKDLVLHYGITRYELEMAVKSGKIKRYILPGCKNAKYLREEVEKVFGKAN
ncbi:MAG: hypothetical protein WC551_12580 [Patescibacteria group bacterium]